MDRDLIRQLLDDAGATRNRDVLAGCSIHGPVLLVLAVIPAVLFALQSVFFPGVGKRVFGDKGGALLFGLVFTSVVLAMGVGVVRDEVLLPGLCAEDSRY